MKGPVELENLIWESKFKLDVYGLKCNFQDLIEFIKGLITRKIDFFSSIWALIRGN